MTTLAEDSLVAHLKAQSNRTVPADTRQRVAQALLDWFTAGWSGSAMALAAPYRAVATAAFPGLGNSPVFGAGALSPLGAGFANAAIAHLREIDDAHRAAMLHPGVVSISPVLALAAEGSLTRRQAIAGMVAGYEVSLRLGEALGTRHASLFHATATAGAVGAAAATAVTLGLPTEQLHHALGIAATQSAGLWQLVDDDAHESKSLHPGFAVRNGMMAAWAAQAGLPGARAFFTGKRGMYALLAGEGPLSAIDVGDGLGLHEGDRLNTTTIKAWPSCAQIFTPLDAMRALMDEHHFVASDVEVIDVTIFPHALKIAGVGWPVRASETPFSLRYVLSALLLKGRLGIDEMEAPDLANPALIALGEKIRVTTSEEFQKSFPERRPAEVSVALKNGRRLTAKRELRRGDPEDPFSWDQLQQRMRAFAPAMSDATAARVTTWCEAFADPARDDERCNPDPLLFVS
ncbi:MmgE/PrpD family protein [Ottowia thiooxydans]|uniref:MmgE/PrpD family protein n=1 Tax=Ottowia thiooxydans TaxID=219182 RepID=UPI0004139F02|nr:MmgE/PrpD family protein [Ottowia thiooxydans]